MNFNSKIFENNKNISLDNFINKALYDLEYGFYMKKNPIGANGDFITSPNISILFSEMLAIWCISFWKKLGCPKKVTIVEMGPGDGSLSLGLIKTFCNFKKFDKAYNLKLLEKSEYLIKIQKKKIISNKVKWISRLSEVGKEPIIIIANEFFDSLPVKQYILKNKQWFERYIRLDSSNKLKFNNVKVKLPNFKKVCNFDVAKNQKFIEFSFEAIKFIKKISKILKKNNGGLICFDYGYTKKKMFNSLQSISNHSYSNLLSNPGYQDITHLINFSFFHKLTTKLNLKNEAIVTQGEFLKRMGIIERANILSSNKNFKEKSEIFYRLKRLIHPNEMGNLFKVFFFKKKGIKFNLGFI